MNGIIDIEPTVDNLKCEVRKYLIDAGFQEYMFNIHSFENREYLKVYMNEKSIDFIVNDIQKTKWRYILEIKKYKEKDKTYSSVFVFKF
jgi:hypothetical protein